MSTAVLLMAYGSPRTPAEIEPYFADIRGGRAPSPESLKELQDRYAQIGGMSPLGEITGRQKNALQQRLDERFPDAYRVYTGMKHWHPFIAEAVEEIVAAGHSRIIGLVLAPHYSKKSIGEYQSRIRSALESIGAPAELRMINSWYDRPELVDLISLNLKTALGGWDASSAAGGDTRVFFTAHSIPKRIIDEGDPYADQVQASADLYARAAGVASYQIGWQSASPTGEPWIGPDILELLEQFASAGGRRAVVAPVGFVSDHLEILFDVDVECAGKAAQLGIELRRIESANDSPLLIDALAGVVSAA